MDINPTTLFIIIAALGFLVLILGYTTFNLLRKNEEIEDIVLNQDDVLQETTNIFRVALKSLKEVDSKGGFEAEDEVGQIFTSIKEIVTLLESDFEAKKW